MAFLRRLVSEFRVSSRAKIKDWKALKFENEVVQDVVATVPKLKAALGFEGMEEYTIYKETRKKVIDPTDMETADSDISKWKVITDKEIGGKTVATVRQRSFQCDKDPTKTRTSIVFEGELHGLESRKRPKDPWWTPNKSKRGGNEPPLLNGYAALVTPPRKINVDPMEIFTLSLKTCGREYFFNVIPDSHFIDNDIYQVKLLSEDNPSPGLHERWVEMDSFLATSGGFSKFYQVPFAKESIKGFSFGIQGQQGPFRLELEWIEARLQDYKDLEELQDRMRKLQAEEDAKKTGMTLREILAAQTDQTRQNPRSRPEIMMEHDPIQKEYLLRELAKERAEQEEEEEETGRWFRSPRAGDGPKE